jgi:hypothetical protein
VVLFDSKSFSGAVRGSDDELIAQITRAGISESWARISLRRCNGNVDEAINFCIESGALEDQRVAPIPENRSHLNKKKKKGNSILSRTFGGFMSSSKQNAVPSQNSVDDECTIESNSLRSVDAAASIASAPPMEDASSTPMEQPPTYDEAPAQSNPTVSGRVSESSPKPHQSPVNVIPRKPSLLATRSPPLTPPLPLGMRARATPPTAASTPPPIAISSHQQEAPPSYDDSTVSSCTSDFPAEDMGSVPGTGSDEVLPSYEESHGDLSTSTPREGSADTADIEENTAGPQNDVESDEDGQLPAATEPEETMPSQSEAELVESDCPVEGSNHDADAGPHEQVREATIVAAPAEVIEEHSPTNPAEDTYTPTTHDSDTREDDVVESGAELEEHAVVSADIDPVATETENVGPAVDSSDETEEARREAVGDRAEPDSDDDVDSSVAADEAVAAVSVATSVLSDLEDAEDDSEVEEDKEEASREEECDSPRVDIVIAAEGAVESVLDVSSDSGREDLTQEISIDDIAVLQTQESIITDDGLTIDDIRLQATSFDETSDCNNTRSVSEATVPSSEDDRSSPTSSRPYSNSTFYLSAPSDNEDDDNSSVASSVKLSSKTYSRRDLLTTQDSSDSLMQRMEAASKPRGKAAGVAVTVDSAGLITAVSRPQPPTVAALAAVELSRANSVGSNEMGRDLSNPRVVSSDVESSPRGSGVATPAPATSRYRAPVSAANVAAVGDAECASPSVASSLSATSPPPQQSTPVAAARSPPPPLFQTSAARPSALSYSAAAAAARPPPLRAVSAGAPVAAEAVEAVSNATSSYAPPRDSGAASAPIMAVAAVAAEVIEEDEEDEPFVASAPTVSRNAAAVAVAAPASTRSDSSSSGILLPLNVVTALSRDSVQSGGYGNGTAMRPESIARLPQASAVSDDTMDDDTVHGEAFVALGMGSSSALRSSSAVSSLYMRDDRGGVYVAVAAPLQSVDDMSSGSGTDHGQTTATDDEEYAERRRGLFSYARHRLYGDEQEARRHRDVSGGARRRVFLPFDINEREGKFFPSVHLRQPKLGPNMGPQHNRPPILNLAPSATRPLAIRHAEVNTPPLWAGGTDRKECAICYHSAGLLYKIHHCRNCGYYVCNNCSKKDWPASMLPKTYVPDKEAVVRVCDSCSYLQEGFVDSLRIGDVNLALAFFSTGNVNLHSPMSIYKSEEYPIHAAAQGGNIHLVRWLLEERKCSLRGGDGEVLKTSEGLTPLAMAAYFGHHEVMSYFVKRHACKVTEIKDFTVLLRGLHAALGVSLDTMTHCDCG